jgi:hypothetical protein
MLLWSKISMDALATGDYSNQVTAAKSGLH